jgi:hypothetical protein
MGRHDAEKVKIDPVEPETVFGSTAFQSWFESVNY